MSEEARTIAELSEREWCEIRSLAIKLFHSERYGKDQMRVAIIAFVLWLSMNEKAISLEKEQFVSIH